MKLRGKGFHPPALLFATRSPVLRHCTTAVTGRAPAPDSPVVAPARASTPRGTQKTACRFHPSFGSLGGG
jgi:hypothetical protein